MINVMPIPLYMLPHTAEYHEYIGKNEEWGGSDNSYAEPVILKKIRIQPGERVYNTSTGESITHKAILFHDSVNSHPAKQTFKEKSKIVWFNQEMFIKEVEPLYAINGSRPHHTEVILI